ncbi:putative hydrolase [Allorhodopirellula solitaria]|uniref:Putative hydrolase n=2 Tax=Allorhodopirellula solitaria TaxID=2527987 RepID=A0A5C5XRW4_9BACT|nr:putative hydrolase [Allorhodopirellula solitaria]
MDSCTTNYAVAQASDAAAVVRDETITSVMDVQAGCRWLAELPIPPFQQHRILRGGHLQTLIGARMGHTDHVGDAVHRCHSIELADGDTLVAHDDEPQNWTPAKGSVLLLHGICGCHSAGYMVRFQRRLNEHGIRTFRLDMRGCGDSAPLCRSITHAGRSEDVLAAIEFIARLVDDVSSPIGALGVSLGANQLLLAAGRVGSGKHTAPVGWDRVGPLLAIAPPMDLQLCSDAMESAKLRFYNWYFIKHLLRRASAPLRERDDYQAMLRLPKPKTLRQFDRQFTAPLAGFDNERDYYRASSAVSVAADIAVPTLIVTSADDPLVPVRSFTTLADRLAQRTQQGTAPKAAGLHHGAVRVHISAAGGHHGFMQRDRTGWTDELVSDFYGSAFASSPARSLTAASDVG